MPKYNSTRCIRCGGPVRGRRFNTCSQACFKAHRTDYFKLRYELKKLASPVPIKATPHVWPPNTPPSLQRAARSEAKARGVDLALIQAEWGVWGKRNAKVNDGSSTRPDDSCVVHSPGHGGGTN